MEFTRFPLTVRLAPEGLARDAQAALERDGGTLVRRGLAPDLAIAIRERTRRFFDDRIAAAKAGQLSSTRFSQQRAGVVLLDELLETPAGVAILETSLRAYVASPVFRSVIGLHGQRIGIPLAMCIIRYVTPGHQPAFVPYHQDVAFMADAHTTLNFWGALSTCGPGYGAPGLEFVSQRLDERLPVVPDEQRKQIYRQQIEVGDELVLARYPAEQIHHPDFEPGDGVLFDHYLLHRTYTVPAFRRTRYSIEIRTARADELLPDWRCIALVTAPGDQATIEIVDRGAASGNAAGSAV